ncbi:MAG: hypothetical protein AUI85_12395 [Acidobacteriales bacterium 13_1_40CM_3_55_5]|nr:MAG: hypothetical protein AUI85_12395 [Acidobacteriales bacterium 13_1_40CM_3_55_5]
MANSNAGVERAQPGTAATGIGSLTGVSTLLLRHPAFDKKRPLIVAHKPTGLSCFPKIGDTKVSNGSHFGNVNGRSSQSEGTIKYSGMANRARYIAFFAQPVACVYLTTLFFRGKLRSMD